MQAETRIVFLMDLLQDVNILRPLILLAAQDLRIPVSILVSHKFTERDAKQVWRNELDEIAAETGAVQHSYSSEWEAWRLLQGGRGAIVSSSETDLGAHVINHNVFRIAPAGFLRITVQHGFECMGFLQNHEHDRAHGRSIVFAADVVCAWTELPALTSLPASERAKVYVSGPPNVLQMKARDADAEQARHGLVCENLHSVRLRASGDFRMSFMETFFAFCETLDQENELVTLRPHPAGQYFEKNNVEVPANVRVEGRPSYKVNFANYAFGISAASSVIVDMVLAGTPVAVWQDADAVMDIGNYAGLTTISTLDDWLAFRRDVRRRPEMILQRQSTFLSRARMVTDAGEVRDRFRRLLGGATAIRTSVATAEAPPQRILFVSNGYIPTLQLSFVKPLLWLKERGRQVWEFISEEGIKEQYGDAWQRAATGAAVAQQIGAFKPDIIVFCRYSGPHYEAMLAHARQNGIATIYHVDDDLLNIPKEIGEQKWKSHNHPTRLNSVRSLLNQVDLVYASTEALRERFRSNGFDRPSRSGRIYCSGAVLNRAELRPVTRIGYMGFDHAHDFALILPSLARYLDRHPHVTFDLFGSIPRPPELDRFGDQVRVVPPVRDYAQFLEYFASLHWDIGICPLATTPFNAVKANTKWVEYTSVGAAVIASRGTVYDGCTADGCGILADGEEEWLAALEQLTDPVLRHATVQRAQARLEADYSVGQLRRQILGMFETARQVRLGTRAEAVPA
jgi:hypothetical protein